MASSTDRGDWPRLLQRLDELLELPPHQQSAAAVAVLDGNDARLRDTLRELLASREAVDRDDFMVTLPRLAADEPAGGVLGPWRLLRELGRSGMSVVHLAVRSDAATAPPVVSKLPLIDPLRAATLAERFARERDNLRSLEHPGIAAVRDAGVADGQPWLAIEYIDGAPITEHVAASGLSVSLRRRLFVQVLEAVGHAHAQLVIHRDIKPANVLVDSGGRAMTPQYPSPATAQRV